jgi:hypothetical protein
MFFIKEFSQKWMQNKYTQPFRTRCKDLGYSGILSKDLGLNLHGASKTKEAFPSKQILSVKPPSPSPPVLVIIYVFICFSERINIVGSK